MLDFQIARQHMGEIGYGDARRSVPRVARARNLFVKSRTLGTLRRWWQKRTTGQDSAIMELDAVSATLALRHRWSAGVQVIPIDQIMGTQGRSKDFDIHFAPLGRSGENRWVELALARICGTALPAIRVIQVNQVYFVVDGHHRVSVAKALGERYIEAEVTIWS